MDDRKYLTEQIKRCKRKMNTAKLMDCGIMSAAAGGIFGMLCELASLIWPFYYAHLAAGLCFAAGLVAGLGYALLRRADMKQAAKRLDSFGLKERMITAWEQMGSEKEFARLQRQDAREHYDRLREQIRVSPVPGGRHVLALLLSILMVAGLGWIPSPVREQAQLRHQVQEQAREELEDLGELMDAMEGVDLDSLTEEQRALIQEMKDAMELSGEELAKADSWESFGSAVERLDYKYGQTAQSLTGLAGQSVNPEAAGIASAEALAKVLANQSGSQLASGGTPGTGSGDGSEGDDSGSDDGREGSDGSGQGNDSGDGQGNGNGNGQGNGNGNGQGNGNSNGNDQGNGNSNGNGQGNGNGNGQGNGNSNGNGQGNGNGSGTGNGRGTGSSDAAHDYVSIPNAVADDPSLSGGRNGSQDSGYFRQQNGLAWEGEHVDYNSVIGEYTDSAYEGIANGKYPSGMESVIRDYFEKLNK